MSSTIPTPSSPPPARRVTDLFPRLLFSIVCMVLLYCCGGIVSGCALTIPNGVAFDANRAQPYQATGDAIITGEAYRCTGRINGLVAKAKAARDATYALTMTGGTVSAGGGLVGSLLVQDADKRGVAAGIAALGGVTAVAGTLLASPADVVSLAEAARGHWNKAEDALRLWAREPVDNAYTRQRLLDTVVLELKACGDT